MWQLEMLTSSWLRPFSQEKKRAAPVWFGFLLVCSSSPLPANLVLSGVKLQRGAAGLRRERRSSDASCQWESTCDFSWSPGGRWLPPGGKFRTPRPRHTHESPRSVSVNSPQRVMKPLYRHSTGDGYQIFFWKAPLVIFSRFNKVDWIRSALQTPHTSYCLFKSSVLAFYYYQESRRTSPKMRKFRRELKELIIMSKSSQSEGSSLTSWKKWCQATAVEKVFKHH